MDIEHVITMTISAMNIVLDDNNKKVYFRMRNSGNDIMKEPRLKNE